MYQHPSQKLKTIGFTSGKGWSEIPVDVSSTVVAPGTAMAMIPLADKRTGKVPLLLKGYVESNQVTQEFSWEWSYWRTGMLKDDHITFPLYRANDSTIFRNNVRRSP